MKDFNKLLLALVLVLIIIVTAVIIFQNWPNSCSQEDWVNTSITIESGGRQFVGFNTDTDSLRFGKVSPEAVVKRTVKVEYDSAGEVSVAMLSQFALWTTITPESFSVLPQQKREVVFEVEVPAQTPDSELTGVVGFCFKE